MHERGNLRSTRLALIEFFLKKLRVFLLICKLRFLSRPLLMHDLRGNYILSLNKPGTTSYGLSSFFFLRIS